jgi:hypothetical protein
MHILKNNKFNKVINIFQNQNNIIQISGGENNNKFISIDHLFKTISKLSLTIIR